MAPGWDDVHLSEIVALIADAGRTCVRSEGTDATLAASNIKDGFHGRSAVNKMRLLIAVAVGAMLVATGCGGATEGAPVAAPSTTSVGAAPAANGAWDPCTIPDSAIEDAGLAVETKSSNLIGKLPISEDWMTCFWTNPLPTPWYRVGIFSSVESLDYLRERGPFENFEPIEGFDGMRFQRTIRYDEVNCGVAFGHPGGVVYLNLDGLVMTPALGDPCVEVERLARSLRLSLPSEK
ncbi:putative uncharacterized protein [Rhodococcus sp. AW25M09]|uniref:DUF3558 domain-containing protein n=1 Tax=Rhodococcus sp. AW25M09 TaxID=1268303 RepID=UPI0002AC4729|nr:DUF3558 domain-containing protein [Rhodococcus sp. AW25M09]CCQ15685.1 putative uncharacterized protein [Rhodococcus sp. AW25M09]